MNDYEKRMIVLVEDFINTYDTYMEVPEHLRVPDDLKRFLAMRGLSSSEVIHEETLEAARQLRTDLRAIWTADEMEKAAQLLNDLLGKSPVIAQLATNGDQAWYLSFTAEKSLSLLQRLSTEAALGIAAGLQHYGIERMRACAAEPCRDVFVDVSRNGTRRFCSDRCANRYNIAAYRERQQGKSTE